MDRLKYLIQQNYTMKKLYPFLFLFSILLFTDCGKDEPCKDIICMNGGVCASGICDCPDNYEDDDCAIQKTPSLVKITKIRVLAFPPMDAGADWDLLDDPDIFIEISYNGQVIYTSGVYGNADAQLEYEWTPITTLNLFAPEEEYNISLLDDDEMGLSEWMGGYWFIPYNDTNDFPSKIILYPTGEPIGFELDIEYEF